MGFTQDARRIVSIPAAPGQRGLKAETTTVEQALARAVAHHRAGELADAERLYRSILDVSPRHPVANHNLGILQLRAKRLPAALFLLETALETTPGEGQYWLSYALALIEAGNLQAARQVLDEGKKRGGLAGEALMQLERRLENLRQGRMLESMPAGSAQTDVPLMPEANEPSTQQLDALDALFFEGRHAAAEQMAKALTERFPEHPLGWKALGTARQMQGRLSEALPAMQAAARRAPADAEVHFNLGLIFLGMGELSEAAAGFRQALALAPELHEAHLLLGQTLQQVGRPDDAEASFREALRIEPDLAEAHLGLGAVLQDQGRLGDAEASYRAALALAPNNAEAHCDLGVVLQALGRLPEAEAAFRQAIALRPGLLAAHRNLGLLLHRSGRLEEAETSLRELLETWPDHAEALSDLGVLLHRSARPEEGERHLREAIRLRPDLAAAHNNLSLLLYDQGRLQEAEASGRRAIELKPDLAEAYSNLGRVYQDTGRLAEAEQCFRQALRLKPGAAELHSNLLFAQTYFFHSSVERQLEDARAFGRIVSGQAGDRFTSWAVVDDPMRLRVGLVSGDLCNHPVGYFLEGVLKELDASRIELIAYPTRPITDALTERIRPHFAGWKPLSNLADDEAARVIHADGVHVLFDLSGHGAYNRLPVFAWKPAPVQVTWLGYSAPTGLAEMDYLLGDRFVTPPGEEHHFTEATWRLPDSLFCFTPPDVQVEPGPLPALATGSVTFCSFNKLSKVTDAVVALWARILHAVPSSRLFLKFSQLNDPAERERTEQRFAVHGIAPERLTLEGASPRAELLAAYRRADIALDPFPYTGTTTTVEGLWMGVPAVTRRGDRFLSHQSESLAHNAGLQDWIAATDEAYVAIAVAYATHLDRLAELRGRLRQQLLSSPLCDARRFARNFEAAVWGMWDQCRAQNRS